jgi:predicted P-loop ATPase
VCPVPQQRPGAEHAQRENGQSVYNCLKRWENLLKEDICKTKLAKEIDQAAKIVAAVFRRLRSNTSRRKPKLNKLIARLLAIKAANTKVQKLADLSA